jgi:hypothetical protein
MRRDRCREAAEAYFENDWLRTEQGRKGVPPPPSTMWRCSACGEYVRGPTVDVLWCTGLVTAKHPIAEMVAVPDEAP